MKSKIISSVRLSGIGHEHSKNNFKIVSKKLIVAVLLVVSISSFAQDQAKPEKKAQQRERQTPEQRTQNQLDKLTTELTLNAQQQEQIKPILVEQNAKLEAMRAQRLGGNAKEMTREERDALRAKRQENKKAIDDKLQAILTPDQFKKMKEIEKANMEKMREARKNGNWGNGDNGGGNMGGDN